MDGARTTGPPLPQRGTVADNGSAGTPTRHTPSTNGARREHGALARREYSFLTPTGTAVNLANAVELGSVNVHEATRGTAG